MLPIPPMKGTQETPLTASSKSNMDFVAQVEGGNASPSSLRREIDVLRLQVAHHLIRGGFGGEVLTSRSERIDG